MHTNEGAADRVLRAILGVVLLAVALAAGLEGAGKIVLMVVGGIALLTGAIGFCPLYRIVGLSTCKR